MTNFEKVGLFMKTFGQEVKTKAELSNSKINDLRISLINEELEELKKAVKDNALNNLKLAEASADAKEVAKNTSQQTLDDISGRTAFNNVLKAGGTTAAAGAAADNAIRAAAANAGIANDIIG